MFVLLLSRYRLAVVNDSLKTAGCRCMRRPVKSDYSEIVERIAMTAMETAASGDAVAASGRFVRGSCQAIEIS